MDVEGLLKAHTVAELKEIEKKLRTDVERKKEDLRQLVSNRYRELIDAADKIKGMYGSVSSVTSHLHMVQALSVAPRDHGKGSATEETSESLLEHSVNHLLRTAPETIFRALENDDVLSAAVTYSFVKNVVWQWNVGPMAFTQQSQWLFLRSYGSFVSEHVHVLFEKIEYEHLECSRCFAALLIMMSSTNLLDVLRIFLEKRQRLLGSLLTSSSAMSVRETLRNSLLCMLSTLRTVHEVFVAQNLLEFMENEITELRIKIFSEFFPDEKPLSEFSVSYDAVMNFGEEERNSDVINEVRGLLRKWLEQAFSQFTTPVSMLLHCVPSVPSVLSVRRSVGTVLSDENRKSPSVKFLAKDLDVNVNDVYGRFDQATKQRFSHLIRERRTGLLDEVGERLRNRIYDTKGPSQSDAQFLVSLTGIDIGNHLTTSGSRFPGRARRAVASQKSGIPVDPSSEIVQLIGGRLSSLWSDMRQTEWSDELEAHWLENEFVSAFSDFFKDFTEFIGSLAPSCSAAALVALHRFIRFLIVHKDDFLDDKMRGLFRENILDGVASNLDASAQSVFHQWLSMVLENWKASTLQLMKQDLDPVVWSSRCTPFVKVVVDEVSESGEAVKYALNVPAKTSITFHNCLTSLHDELLEFSNYKPKSLINDAAVNRCFTVLTQCYEEALRPPSRLTKNQALQMIFDVKTALAFARARKAYPLGSVRMMQGVVDQIAQFVDPIDYNVFLPFLERNVTIHAASIKNLFCALTVIDNVQSVPAVPVPEIGKSEQLPLTVFKPVWFSQLPVASSVGKARGKE